MKHVTIETFQGKANILGKERDIEVDVCAGEGAFALTISRLGNAEVSAVLDMICAPAVNPADKAQATKAPVASKEAPPAKEPAPAKEKPAAPPAASAKDKPNGKAKEPAPVVTPPAAAAPKPAKTAPKATASAPAPAASLDMPTGDEDEEDEDEAKPAEDAEPGDEADTGLLPIPDSLKAPSTKMRDVITYLNERGYRTKEQIVEACKYIQDEVPILARMQDIDERVQRSLEVMGYTQ